MGKSKKAKLEVVSTNDVGQFLDAMVPSTTTADGWSNPVTGMGFLGRDKGESTLYRPDTPLTSQELDSLGRDGFGRIIVDSVVEDAMRSGWVVNFKGDDDTEVTPEEAQEFNERLQTWYKDTKLKARVSQHLKQARQYGGALLVLGAVDGQKPDQKLNLERVTEFNWMRTHDRVQVSQSSEVNSDPRSVGFGFAELYTLHSTSLMRGADRDKTLVDTWVHNSRVWRTDGVLLAERVRQQNFGWGDSVLESCREQLGNRGSVMKSARTVVQEWVLGVYKLKNLTGIILANGEDKVRGRFSLMDRLKSMWQSIAVDADNESFERIATTAAGLPELLDRFGIDLAAVARMPMTKLFGLSPGGFGTGEAEGDNWDDKTKSYQTDDVGPLLEYIHKILFATPDFADFPKNWSIKFNSLQLTSPLEDAEVRLKTSQADALDITSGVLGADEVAVSRYGGSNYSTETVLDEEAREMDAALEAGASEAGAPEESGLSVVGENLSDVLGVLKDVTSGAMTEKAAEMVLRLAYPTVEASEFRRLVKESAKADPPTAPPAIPPSAEAGQASEGAESTEPDSSKPPSNSDGNGV